MARAVAVVGTVMLLLHATPKALAAPDPDDVAQAANQAGVDEVDLLGALLTVHEDDPQRYLVRTGELHAPTQSPPNIWDSLAQCESNGRWSIASGNGYYGGIQIDQVAWRRYGGPSFASNAALASRAQQILIGQRILATQGPAAWPVCSRVVGMR
jgi:hypothetical protein